MPDNKISEIPQFTTDESTPVQEEIEEVKQEEEVEETTSPEETETPTQLPGDKEPDGTTNKPVEDTSDLSKAIQSLQQEKTLLLKDIADLRGQRREIKQEQLTNVQKQIDDLKDLHPEDIAVIDRVLRAKGYMTKEESHQMYYEDVKNQQLNSFLEKYPEYKPENDPGDLKWASLQKELGYYKTPTDPKLVGMLLERAHKEISQVVSDRGTNTAVKQRQIKTAGMGAGGAQLSSSGKALDPEKAFMLRQGGWSEEEIKRIEQNLK